MNALHLALDELDVALLHTVDVVLHLVLDLLQSVELHLCLILVGPLHVQNFGDQETQVMQEAHLLGIFVIVAGRQDDDRVKLLFLPLRTLLEVGLEDLDLDVEIALVLVHHPILLVQDLIVTRLDDGDHEVEHDDLVEDAVHEPDDPDDDDEDFHGCREGIDVAMRLSVLIHLLVLLNILFVLGRLDVTQGITPHLQDKHDEVRAVGKVFRVRHSTSKDIEHDREYEQPKEHEDEEE